MSFPCCHNFSSFPDAVYLRDKERESPTHSGINRSRLQSDLASDITSDKKPHVHSSLANLQHIIAPGIIDPHVVSDEFGVTDGSSSDSMDLSNDWTTPSQSVSSSSHSRCHSSMQDSSKIATTIYAPSRNPGSPFPTRFERLAELGDLGQDSASQSIEDFSTLGAQVLRRFERFGDFSDLKKAISLLEDFVRSASVSDTRYLVGLAKLGVALSYRFRHLGNLNDLEEAISRHRDAVDLTPDGNPHKPSHLNELGNDLRARFERLGQLGDLEQAIWRHRDAVDLTPDGQANKAVHLNNLGNDFRARFDHLRELKDLDQAISRHSDAVDLTPDDHPNKPGYLNDLGNDFRTRFQCLGERKDLEQAISSPAPASDGHPDKPGHRNSSKLVPTGSPLRN